MLFAKKRSISKLAGSALFLRRVTMKKIVVQLFGFCMFMLLPHFGYPITLPFEEKFDAPVYKTGVWTSGGGTHAWVENGGWRGGAAKFRAADQFMANVGLGQFTGLNTARLNIRFLVKFGSTMTNYDTGKGGKFLIINRASQRDEHRVIVMMHSYLDENWDIGVGNNISPVYPNPVIFNINQNENVWICMELEADITTGTIKYWITKQDGSWNERLYLQVPLTDPGVSNWDYIDLIGGPGGLSTGADQNAYWMFDEVKISNSYIGPPPGFVQNSTTPNYPNIISITPPQ